ncbi:DNA topoisomerase I [Babesia caballi]|uniref:DNA topoisomerase I n=1 Tax=Babesia caballi TaxID=5871 RepID=A0AAV4LRQ0_BABCB|nr:DNA topoisomerase I [Babesia caballi]
MVTNFLELIEYVFKFSLGILKYLLTDSIHFLPNLPNQLLKPIRHLTGANALPKSSNDFQNFTMTRSLNPQKPLEEADDKVQHGVANLILRDVSEKNAASGEFGGTSITKHSTLIPNELLKPLGQFGNEAIRITIQSTCNLLYLRT